MIDSFRFGYSYGISELCELVLLVRSCLLITLIKCIKGQKSLELFSGSVLTMVSHEDNGALPTPIELSGNS